MPRRKSESGEDTVDSVSSVDTVSGEAVESGSEAAAEPAVSDASSEAPKPPEVEVIDEAIKFIKERLPLVYGVGKYEKIIVNALKDDPTPLRDPSLLHSFIKSIAPRAYDTHLALNLIKPLYAKFPNLPQAVDRYLSMTSQTIPAPQPYYVAQVQQLSHQYYPYHVPLYQTYHSNPYMPMYNPYMPTMYAPYQYMHHVKPPKTYKIVVDGQEIETDEAGFMAWQRFLREREEHELRMKKLEAEIKKILEETRSKEVTVPVKIGDKEVQVPAYLAPLFMNRDDEHRKEIEKLREELHRKEVELLKREIEELKKRPSFIEELQAYNAIASMLGYQKGGRTTLDLLNSIVERIDERAAQLLNKIPPPQNVEWKPEIKRTPEERAKKAEEIMRRIEKSEEILKAEEELIRAAAKVKPRTG